MVKEELSQVAMTNDLFRLCGFGVTITTGAQILEDTQGLLHAVRKFDRFKPGSDPYGEHDFGALRWKDALVFWKIDYCDKELKY